MSSGVTVNDECLSAFEDLKIRKMYKYIIFKLSDDKETIVVEKKANDSTYDDFVSQLPKDEPRYAVYDFEFEMEKEGKRNKIVFYSWNPDTSSIKQKMLYASSKEAIKKTLIGVAFNVQGNDESDVDYDTVLYNIKRGTK